ncbi:hypothetical protein PENTCL1PPCAC_17147 [Pristionchus entomophagus]|uniref:Uncharacterized protein n=1 Tax=Pristionchus entomophagus TaxID=358040 RepID=A0AAV5TL43_9BILA|nr:hypothetical protein PENTCL1PPCAC_17147 [Pristionchus entomophagus]
MSFLPLVSQGSRMRELPPTTYFDSNSDKYYNGRACCRLHVEKAARLSSVIYAVISILGDLVFGQYISLSLSLLLTILLLIGVFKRAHSFLLVAIGVAMLGLAYYIFCLGYNAWLIIRIIVTPPNKVLDQDEEEIPRTVFEIVRLLLNISLGSYLLHVLHCFWRYLTESERFNKPFRIDEARLDAMIQQMNEKKQKRSSMKTPRA